MLRNIDHFGADSMRSIYIIVTHKFPTIAARGLNTQTCGVKTEVMWAVYCIHTLSKVSFFNVIMCRFSTIDLDHYIPVWCAPVLAVDFITFSFEAIQPIYMKFMHDLNEFRKGLTRIVHIQGLFISISGTQRFAYIRQIDKNVFN